MMSERKGRGLPYAVVLLLGAVGGVLVLSALRFVGQPENHGVHYHANWAVVVDGQRLDLTGNRYMEDVFQCSVDPDHQRPEDRAHMHEGNDDVVHVHDAGVTWEHFLANIGFSVGDGLLETDQATYRDGDGRTLKLIANGAEVSTLRNRPVLDEERLLISFGPESVEEVIAGQYPMVESTAGEYNVMPDPASCSGQHAATLGDRIRRAVWY